MQAKIPAPAGFRPRGDSGTASPDASPSRVRRRRPRDLGQRRGDHRGESGERRVEPVRAKPVLHLGAEPRDLSRTDAERRALEGMGAVGALDGGRRRVEDPGEEPSALPFEQAEQLAREGVVPLRLEVQMGAVEERNGRHGFLPARRAWRAVRTAAGFEACPQAAARRPRPV